LPLNGSGDISLARNCERTDISIMGSGDVSSIEVGNRGIRYFPLKGSGDVK